MKKNTLLIIILLIFVIITGCGNKNNEKINNDSKYMTGKHHVVISVKDYGNISLELDADVAPITVTNFINLASDGFYDGLTFHRIMDGFMIQGGAGTNEKKANTIKGEFLLNGVENNISHVRGVISMARIGDEYDSASSQFFIVHEDSTFLDYKYAGFGYVTSGMEVVDKIASDAKPIDDNGTILVSEQPIITTIKVID